MLNPTSKLAYPFFGDKLHGLVEDGMNDSHFLDSAAGFTFALVAVRVPQRILQKTDLLRLFRNINIFYFLLNLMVSECLTALLGRLLEEFLRS